MGVVLDYLSVAAAAIPRAPVDPGWTPTTTMGLISNLLLGGGGGILLKIFANHLLAMRKIADARAQQVDERADGYTDKLTLRVGELEEALSVERRECDKQLAEMRGELREMQQKMDGFMRQLITYQSSEARAMHLSPQMAKAVDSLDNIKGTGE